jgi:uncharacterized protein YbcV (DUF1398 family)
MQNLEQILINSKSNKWPFPKTFEALIEAGVTSYSVHFGAQFKSIYQGNFGTFQEETLSGYYPLTTARIFSAQGVKDSIIKHIQEKTSYVEFLADIAAFGASHYVVDMAKRRVTYFNADETQFHIENVPYWKE